MEPIEKNNKPIKLIITNAFTVFIPMTSSEVTYSTVLVGQKTQRQRCAFFNWNTNWGENT